MICERCGEKIRPWNLTGIMNKKVHYWCEFLIKINNENETPNANSDV